MKNNINLEEQENQNDGKGIQECFCPQCGYTDVGEGTCPACGGPMECIEKKEEENKNSS